VAAVTVGFFFDGSRLAGLGWNMVGIRELCPQWCPQAEFWSGGESWGQALSEAEIFLLHQTNFYISLEVLWKYASGFYVQSFVRVY